MSFLPKLLIVDDDPRMCDNLKELLSDRDYKIHTTHSGNEAMECLSILN